MNWLSAMWGGRGRRASLTRKSAFTRLHAEPLEPRLALASLPAGFGETVVASNLTNATTMEFSPDWKLFVAEQAGTMEVWRNGVRLQADFFANTPLATQSTGERGLLGVAFDPNYATNRFVYVYYTTTAADAHNRVSRFTANANGDLALAGSEQIVLELEPHAATNHNGGAIHFGRDGKLYIAVGDNANQNNNTGVHNSQRLTTLHGKMLRINADGTIPTDNPFYNTTTGNNRAIWALGLRNPYTFAFHPGTGQMYINDVGQNTWEEIDPGLAGGNYGWPATEGTFNQGSFPNYIEPVFAYNHSSSVTTPSGSAITGGAFYDGPTHAYPSRFNGTYFFADITAGWIYNFDPNTQAVTQFATGAAGPVGLQVDFTGSLHYVTYGSSGSVFKVTYNAPNNAPVLDPSRSPALIDTAEDALPPFGPIGTLVSSLVDYPGSGGLDNVTDVDAQSNLGIAIVGIGTTPAQGTWYFTTDNGATWTTFSIANLTTAKLLAADAFTRLYFRPAPDFNSVISAALTFRVWDQRTGASYGDTSFNGNGFTFSAATDTISLWVVPFNDAPVLDPSKSPALDAVLRNSGAPSGAVGTLVSQLVDFMIPAGGLDNVSDVDAGAQLGIAVTSGNEIQGTWYYSVNNGATWSLLGSVTNTSARLLAADSQTRLYFRPNAGFNGLLTVAIAFRAWDRTRGTNGSLLDTSINGGREAFSVSSDLASIIVT